MNLSYKERGHLWFYNPFVQQIFTSYKRQNFTQNLSIIVLSLYPYGGKQIILVVNDHKLMYIINIYLKHLSIFNFKPLAIMNLGIRSHEFVQFKAQKSNLIISGPTKLYKKWDDIISGPTKFNNISVQKPDLIILGPTKF